MSQHLVIEQAAAYEFNVNSPLVELVTVSTKFFSEAYQADAHHQSLVNRNGSALTRWAVRGSKGFQELSQADICEICFALED
jgi:hypothetical protein